MFMGGVIFHDANPGEDDSDSLDSKMSLFLECMQMKQWDVPVRSCQLIF